MIYKAFIILFMLACGLWAYVDGETIFTAVVSGVFLGGIIAIITMLIGALFLYIFIIPLAAISGTIYGVLELLHEGNQAKRSAHRH